MSNVQNLHGAFSHYTFVQIMQDTIIRTARQTESSHFQPGANRKEKANTKRTLGKTVVANTCYQEITKQKELRSQS